MLRTRVLSQPSPEVRPDLAAARREGDRSELSQSIARYQEKLGAPPPAVNNAARLADPDAAVVIAGQQPGLLGGPLLVLAKALSALAHADRLAEESGRPVIPVFWVASEDHDLDEVNVAHLLTAADSIEKLRLDRQPDGSMLSAIDPGAEAATLLARAEEVLPKTTHLAAALEGPRGADHSSLGEWFAGILSRWLGGRGLVLVHPYQFRQAAAGVLALEHERPGALSSACTEGPVTVAPIPFFRVAEGRRIRVTRAEDLPRDPDEVSWDVTARVLAQNLALPVAGQVVGPTELRYCRQFVPAHELLGIPAPALLPRASLTLVEGKVERALGRFGVDLADVLDRGDEALRSAGFKPEQFDRALTGLTEALSAALPDVQEEAGKVDDVLARKAAGIEREIQRSIDRLRDHARKAMDRATGTDRERAGKVLAHLTPLNLPQDRVLSPLPFLARHGVGLLKRLLEVVRRNPSAHTAVFLSGREEESA